MIEIKFFKKFCTKKKIFLVSISKRKEIFFVWWKAKYFFNSGTLQKENHKLGMQEKLIIKSNLLYDSQHDLGRNDIRRENDNFN
ncbi:MAG: hypothetical protein N3D80_08500 [Ignavibacterium album]|uniref:hypothetical protein n=1 Tax=Ignavibacterium album TaxID=591197 RepID=UPI0026EF1CDF|nr:hypothetical protein [Ignavibacterium album]MCX8105892.1 hypothetical protein [Ignavibacterium album]